MLLQSLQIKIINYKQLSSEIAKFERVFYIPELSFYFSNLFA